MFVLVSLVGKVLDNMKVKIDKKLFKKAKKLTGIKDKNLLVDMGLQALIHFESAKRLAKLGGTEKCLDKIRRRRSKK